MTDMCQRIDMLLKQQGISGAKMSLDLGMSRSFMTELRKGRAKSIKIETAHKIANYLGVPVDFLLSGFYPPDFTPDDENPHELELRDTFASLDIDDQIYVKNWVSGFAKDPDNAKKSPTEAKLSEGEKELLALFRKVPEDKQAMVIQMIRAALETK